MKIALASQRYEHPEGQLRAELARCDFLKIIAKEAREVLVDLGAEPFARFQEAGIGGLDINRSHPLAGTGIGRELTASELGAFDLPYRGMAPIWHNLEAGAFVCEYLVADPDDPRADPQQRFIHDECAEEFARELDRVLADEGAARVCSLPELKYRYYPHCPRMAALWESLIAWANDHHLNEKSDVRRWCLGAAFYTLDWWSQHPEAHAKVLLPGLGVREYAPFIELVEPLAGFEDWLADLEDREDYINRQLTAALTEMRASGFLQTRVNERRWRNWMNGELNEYCDRSEQHFASHGWERPKERPELLKHLEWAVRFQVKKETLNGIAVRKNVEPNAVRKAVNGVLDLIGLERRPVKRGKPAGSKDSKESPRQLFKPRRSRRKP